MARPYRRFSLPVSAKINQVVKSTEVGQSELAPNFGAWGSAQRGYRLPAGVPGREFSLRSTPDVVVLGIGALMLARAVAPLSAGVK